MNEEFQTAFDEVNQNAPQTEPTTDTIDVPSVDTSQEVTQPTEPPVQTFEINGATVTLDELQRGYMRQSDYTKKTQELARQREQVQPQQNTQQHQRQNQTQNPQANPYTNPYANPYEQRIVELEQRFADEQLDRMITTLKEKYSDFDEVKVLNEAYERGTSDLEFVYRATRETQQVDTQTLKEQLRQEIMQEIQSNAQATGTIVNQSNVPLQNNAINLSAQELSICEEMGLTAEEYISYK